jgi:superfamily II DNA or RNA helicase
LNKNVWFRPESLFRLTDGATWSRGLSLSRGQRAVSSLNIQRASGHWVVSGRVQGSRPHPYEVTIRTSLSPLGEVVTWNSVCSCPVGSQCKHGVALMITAAHQGYALLNNPSPNARFSSQPDSAAIEAQRKAAQMRMAELAQMEAENQLLRWLHEMDRANRMSVPGVPPARAESQHPGHAKPEQYLYLLSVTGSGTVPRQLHIDVVVSYLKLNGDWAKCKIIRYPPYPGEAVYDHATPADHEALQLIRSLASAHFRSYGSSCSGTPQGRAGLLALELAAGTGRLYMNNGHGAPAQAMTWGPPRRLRWEWHEVSSVKASESGWALRALPVEGDAVLCLNNPPLYLDATQGCCGPAEAEGIPAAQLQVLLKAPPLKPAALQKHQGRLMRHLGGLPPPPGIQAVSVLRGVTPVACLHLTPVAQANIAQRGLVEALLRFDYQGHCGWWADQQSTVLLELPGGNLLLHRDLAAEHAALTRLANLGLRAAGEGAFGIAGYQSQQPWLHWADGGFAALTDAGFNVTLDDALKDWISRADTLSVQMKPHGDGAGDDEATSPWFDLSLGMEIDGQRHNILPWLPELLAQAAAGAPDPQTGLPNLPPFIYVHAPSGSGFIRLPTEALKPWMAALLELVGDREHNFSGDSLKLSRLDALRTSASLGEGAVWEGAQSLREMLRQLSGRAELPVVAVPQSVQANLRPYQQQGLNWLQFLRRHSLHGILADDMGLGKTLQTLVHIQVEKDAGRLTHPALIIAPVSLMGNWQREIARFCPQLRSLVVHGKDRHAVAGTMSRHDIVIAPYSLLQRDRERWLDAQWHIVVLDEAQNIKNASTHAAQVAGQLQTRHRLCLSGTPMENHLGEIWSLYHFLMPGFLGSQKRFATLFRTPIERQGNSERMTQLRARVTPFMLRRTKAVVAAELPPKVETVLRVELSGKQADLYETIRLGMEKTVRDALMAKGLAKSHITILDALLKLRQVCCDPQLVPLAAAKNVKTSAKLEQLMEMLPEMLAEGRRILLFSQFTSMLTLIEAELAARKLNWVKLTGQSQKRDALIEQFTSGQVPLFLISLKAGGVGLNLPQADTVIHYDPWWNPAVENQATDRAHRIGQTQSVWVVKLVAQGTIEERILALQERKAALADNMYSGSTGRKQPLFTENDLAELLKPLSAM